MSHDQSRRSKWSGEQLENSNAIDRFFGGAYSLVISVVFMEWHFFHCFQVDWNLEVLVFVEGGKPENPAKNPRSRYENKQQTQLNWRQLQNSNPDHIGGRRALSPLRHPCPLVVGFLLYVARRMNNKRFNFPFRLFLSPFWHKEKLIGR